MNTTEKRLHGLVREVGTEFKRRPPMSTERTAILCATVLIGMLILCIALTIVFGEMRGCRAACGNSGMLRWTDKNPISSAYAPEKCECKP